MAFWDESVDDVEPTYAILYEVRVNGVFDGAGIGIDRWITYGTQASNTFSVQAIDTAGNRSPAARSRLTTNSVSGGCAGSLVPGAHRNVGPVRRCRLSRLHGHVGLSETRVR